MPENNAEIALENHIHNFILENPGCYLRSIKNRLGISMGTVQYHLNRLEKIGAIKSSKRFYRSYFPANINESDKKILEILSQERTRDILLLIIEFRIPTQMEIYKKIGISQSSVSWHLQRLIALDIVQEIRKGKYKRYQIVGGSEECKRIMQIMKNYYPSIWNNWSDRITEFFL